MLVPKMKDLIQLSNDFYFWKEPLACRTFGKHPHPVIILIDISFDKCIKQNFQHFTNSGGPMRWRLYAINSTIYSTNVKYRRGQCCCCQKWQCPIAKVNSLAPMYYFHDVYSDLRNVP